MMKIDLTNVSRHAKALVLFLFAPLMSQAQTASSFYQPGVTTEGAVYFLPKTAVRVTVQVEKTTYTPGDFCKYAERYLRIKGVSPTPSVSYRITTIRQEAVAVADTSKRYAVEFNAKTSASNVNLSSDGILLSINTDPVRRPSAKSFTPAPRPAAVNPRQYMSEEILAAGSTAKMAELTAQDIYEIRESRNLLVRGQADNMPKDGEQLRLMLNQLDLQDRSMTSLFTGITAKDTTEHTLTVVPDREVNRELLFRFSSKLGIVDDDDLSGVPYYISIENLKTVPEAEPTDPKKKLKQVPGIYVNVPGKMRSRVSNASETLISSEFAAGQFGNVELLSGALFNKRYTTHLWLDPLSGAIEKLDAEQPK
jgi:hypothetical protein